MIKLTKFADIKSASTQQRPAIAGYLANEFAVLCEHLGDGVPLEDFDLSPHGAMTLVGPEDATLDLQAMLERLPGQWPEFVDLMTLEDGSTLYRAGFLIDNDLCPMVYFPTNRCLHPSVTAWLQEQAGEADNSEIDLPEPF